MRRLRALAAGAGAPAHGAGAAAQQRPAAADGGFPHGVAVGGDLRAVLAALPPPRQGATRLLLVRHGESTDNLSHRLSGGGSNAGLTPRGAAQAATLAAALLEQYEPSSVALIGSSTLSRASATADTIAERFPQAGRGEYADLREMSYGALEGAELRKVGGEVQRIARRWRSGEITLPVGGAGGEGPEQAATRARHAVVNAVHCVEVGAVVVLVCHSHLNKALIAGAVPGLGLSRIHDVPQRNCAVNVIDVNIDDVAADGNGGLHVLAVDLAAAEPPTA